MKMVKRFSHTLQKLDKLYTKSGYELEKAIEQVLTLK